jgi:heat shock protein 5
MRWALVLLVAAESYFGLGSPAPSPAEKPSKSARANFTTGDDAEKLPEGPVIGIDLGTTYSCVAAIMKDEYGQPRVNIIPNDQGNRITPSYVAYVGGNRMVGEAAKNYAPEEPTQVIFDVKRFIGRAYADPVVAQEKARLPFSIVEQDGKVKIEVKVGHTDVKYSPEEVSSVVLAKMKSIAEKRLGEKVGHAVVTVPAYFNDAQRQATKNAGTIAGLKVLRILNEPTAAAIAYGLGKLQEETILVFDLGGGTFDVSLLNIQNGVFEVLATAGDTHLGGEDFDARVMKHMTDLFEKKSGHDMTKNKRAMSRLRREVEKAKRALSSAHQTRVEVDGIFKGVDMSEPLTRAKFEDLCGDLFKKTLKPVDRVLEEAALKREELTEVVLVGGSTRIPMVRSLLREHLKKEPKSSLNPDEAVAYGAAVQAGILAGNTIGTEVLLLDVTPLSLGTEVGTGGKMAVIIPKNTVVPTKESGSFTTTSDYQSSIRVSVYQGERKVAKKNHFLGEFLMSVPPVKKGVPKIELTYDIDVNGILRVEAHDQAAGTRKHLTISNDKQRLSDKEVGRMIREAAKYADQDLAFEERVNAISAFEHYLDSAEAPLKSGGYESLSDKDKKIIKEAVQKGRDFLGVRWSGLKLEDVKQQHAEAEKLIGEILEKIYANGGGGRGKDDDGDADDDDDDDGDNADNEL